MLVTEFKKLISARPTLSLSICNVYIMPGRRMLIELKDTALMNITPLFVIALSVQPRLESRKQSEDNWYPPKHALGFLFF